MSNLSSPLLPFSVRTATPADLDACCALDLSYETEYVWQIDIHDDNDAIALNFRTTRLPRTRHDTAPRQRQNLAEALAQPQVWPAFVAEQAPPPATEQAATLCGYIILQHDTGRSLLQVSDLAVGRAWRRKGIGTQLILAAYQHGLALAAAQLFVPVASQNYPAICFCQQRGFQFCGYHDHYYRNGDVAIFFRQRIKDTH
jgi:ribosomal protein S18 acetylase RimI-like enzyme